MSANDILHTNKHTMGWLRLVGSLKLQVSFAKEPYQRDYILQKKPMILRSLLIVATPYIFLHVCERHTPHQQTHYIQRCVFLRIYVHACIRTNVCMWSWHGRLFVRMHAEKRRNAGKENRRKHKKSNTWKMKKGAKRRKRWEREREREREKARSCTHSSPEVWGGFG